MSCPICTRETDPKYHPFCSRRCADVDLAHWLNGHYAIPATSAEEDPLPPAETPPARPQ